MKPTVAAVLLLVLFILASFSYSTNHIDPNTYLQWEKPHINFPDFSIEWGMIPSPPVPCNNTAGVYSGMSFYQICGNVASLAVYPYIQRLISESWTILSVPHPGGGVYNHSAAHITNKIIVSGGSINPSDYYDYTTVYNTSANTWLPSTPMPQAHMINTTMVSNGSSTCWLLGGEIGGTGTVLNMVYKWAPDDTSMQAMAPMPAPRKKVAAAYVLGKIYVFGGAQYGNTGTNTIWRYDCIANTWTVLPVQLLHTRTGAAAVQAMNADIFILGGQNGSTYLSSVEKWAVESSTTEEVAPMLFSTAGMAAGGHSWGYPKNRDEEYGAGIIVSGGYNGALVTQANAASIESGEVEASSLGNIKALFH